MPIEEKTMAKRNFKEKVLIFDYDDTIVNFVGHLCALHNKLYDTCVYESDMSKWDFEDIEVKDARGNIVKGTELRETFLYYEQHGLYAQLPLLSDSFHALDMMSDMGYRIIIMTARKKEYEEATKLNILMHNLPVDVKTDVYFSHNKAADIRKLSRKYNIQVFADDKASTVRDVFENCNVNNVYLINKHHNKNEEVDEEITRIDNVFEITRHLRKVK